MARLIYLVDDDDVVRDSAALLLRANGFEVASFANAPDFLASVEADRPGCVMLDITMPEMDGLAAQEQLNNRGINFPVLILTGEGDIGRAVRAMKNGAIEFLEKPYDEAELLNALSAGFALLDQRVSDAVKTDEARQKVDSLSNRERQVMQGLLDGLPNKLIAYHLNLSTRTVESFRASLMEKLGVRTASAAVKIALAAGLVGLAEATVSATPDGVDG